MTDPWLLIVDDDPDVAALIAMAATRCGYHTCTAPTLADALALLAAADGKPTAVVLDLYLEDASPTDVCAIMRQHAGPEAFLVAMTADLTIAEASVPDADILIHKPFDISSLLQSLTDRLPGNRT